MKFSEAVKSVFSKYAVFSGRARRSEYWYFFLFNFIVSLILGFIGTRLFGTIGNSSTDIVSLIWSLAVLLPGLAVAVRRLHDIGRSGFWIFIILIPLVGWIIMIVWLIKDSAPGENKYGPNPKY